ncbi:hypothetical protein Tco_0361843, partial [Tanacetum coccineum]
MISILVYASRSAFAGRDSSCPGKYKYFSSCRDCHIKGESYEAREEKEEDASKQGRKIADLDDDAEPIVNAAMTTSSSPVIVVDPVTTVGEVVTTASA